MIHFYELSSMDVSQRARLLRRAEIQIVSSLPHKRVVVIRGPQPGSPAGVVV